MENTAIENTATSNKELFFGRLGQEPDLKKTKTNKMICKLSVAVKNISGGVDWKNVAVWGRQAEICEAQLRKGSEVFVRGRNKISEYTNKDGEIKQYSEINADLLGFTNI